MASDLSSDDVPAGDRMSAGGDVPGYVTAWEPSMRLALKIATRAPARAPGADLDVPVGAIVLGPDGAVLGKGRNRCQALGDPTAHAEIVAIRRAARAARSWRLDGCTLVVTLEPCTMCAGALRVSRIGRLVYGAPDPRAGAAGSLWDLVRDRRLGPHVEVIGGVLAAPCAALLSEFFAGLRRARQADLDSGRLSGGGVA